jgi:hypothetical protein
VLRVAWSKCDRAGQYSVAGLIELYGSDTGSPDFKDDITGNCPLRAKAQRLLGHLRRALPWPHREAMYVRQPPACTGRARRQLRGGGLSRKRKMETFTRNICVRPGKLL